MLAPKRMDSSEAVSFEGESYANGAVAAKSLLFIGTQYGGEAAVNPLFHTNEIGLVESVLSTFLAFSPFI